MQSLYLLLNNYYFFDIGRNRNMVIHSVNKPDLIRKFPRTPKIPSPPEKVPEKKPSKENHDRSGK